MTRFQPFCACRRFLILFCLLVTPALTSCGDEQVTQPVNQSVASIEVTPSAQTLSALGETAQLSAQARTAAGTQVTGRTFTWASSDPDVLSVDAASGIVTAEANGSASISATVDGVTGQATVEVLQEVTELVLSPGEWIIGVGEARSITARATDANGEAVEDPALVWESTNESVLTVDQSGLARGVETGSARVTATAGSVEGVSDLTVGEVPIGAEAITYTTRTARAVRSPAVLVDGSLYVRYGAVINAEEDWTAVPTENITQFEWLSNRMGVLAGGTLSVTDAVNGLIDVHTSFESAAQGPERNTWVAVRGGVVRFQLEGDRIGALQDAGLFSVKDGTNGPWTDLVGSGAADFQLEGNRIGVLHDDGLFRVKDGINGAWTVLVAAGAADFRLEGNRIGVLHDDGLFRVKDGINGPWSILVASGAADFQLEGNRIGVLHDDGLFRVKDGINGPWSILVASGAADFQFDGNRIGVLHDDGQFRVKDGINGPWSILFASGAADFQLDGNRIGVFREDGLFKIKSGINGGWTDLDDGPWGADAPPQFRVGVVAQVIYRTTSQYMAAQRTACRDEFADPLTTNGHHRCYPANEAGAVFAWPPLVDKYGRWGGGGIPAQTDSWPSPSWLGGVNPDVLDAVDGLFREHDNTGPLYPHVPGDDNAWAHVQSACIVRYGLEHDAVTIDGVARHFDALRGRPLWQATVEARDAWLSDTGTVCRHGPLNWYDGFIEAAPHFADDARVPPNVPG